MSAPGMIEFDAKDAAGVSHHYLCPFVPAEEGIDVALWLLANLGSVIAGAIPDVLSKFLDEGSALDLDLATAIEALTPDVMANAASQWKAALLSPDAKRILRILLKYGARDGAPISLTFYQGNYGEMMAVAFKIIQGNRFFSWPGTSASSGT